MATQTETRTRKPSVNVRKFLSIYIKGCKAGKTNEEIAADLDMEPNSVTSRASQLRKRLKEQTPSVALPYPKSTRGAGGESFDSAVDLVRDLLGEDEDEGEDEAGE